MIAAEEEWDRMLRRKLMPLVVLVALALGLVACGGSAGGAAPALQGTTVQGKTFDLTQTHGAPTVVNFFASWCPSCVAEAGDLVAFAAAHPDVRFVGVAVNDAKADVQRFAAEYRVPYTIVMDESGTIAGAWGVNGIPATFFVDRDGKQQASMVGAATRAQFEEKLKSIQ